MPEPVTRSLTVLETRTWLRAAAAAIRARLLPVELDVRERPRHEHDVAGAGAEDTVGDVHTAASRVPGLGFHCLPRVLQAL